MITAPGIFWSLISWLKASAILASRCEDRPTSSGFAEGGDCAHATGVNATNATAHDRLVMGHEHHGELHGREPRQGRAARALRAAVAAHHALARAGAGQARSLSY